MLRKIISYISIVVLLANVYGCTLFIAGAAGGAGTAYWLSNKLVQTIDTPVEPAGKQVKLALNELALPIEKEVYSQDTAKFVAKYYNDKTVWVDVEKVDEKSSRIEVRVGAKPDKEAAQKILDQILKAQM